MFFCDKCGYSYNYTKDVKNKQSGGKNKNDILKNIFEKYYQHGQINVEDLVEIRGSDLLKDERFDKMNKKDQRKFMTMIKNIDKHFFLESAEESKQNLENINIAYFVCKYCNYHKPIKSGTIIYSKDHNNNATTEIDDFTGMIDNYTLPRTRNYMCKNKKCETYKNIDIKEAVITKNRAERIVYICTICTTHWIESDV